MNVQTLSYTKTLDYCDGIQLFEARDPIGGELHCHAVGRRRWL